MASLFRRSRLAVALRWLVPSLFAACAGALAAGVVEAPGAGDALPGMATVGFDAMLALPLLFAASLLVRAVWAAWRPRALAEALVEDGGSMPRLAGWLIVLGLAAFALGWATFQGIWVLANHTAFKALPVSFAEPGMVIAAAAVLVAVSRPAAYGIAWLLRRLDARWRRHGWRSLLTPYRIATALVVLALVGLQLVWRIVVKPKIGPFDTSLFDAPLIGLAVWGLAHVAWGLLPRARSRAAIALGAASGVAMAVATFAMFARPSATLEIWGDRPLAGVAIENLFDLDDIRARIDLTEFAPTPAPGAAHPDIVLVTIDTVRADHTPPYSEHAADMPVLRQLGKVGAVFEWAFSPSNVTRRSIPSMVIGLQPNRVHGRVVGWALRVDPRHVLLAERLAAGGYDTAGFMCCEGFWGKEFHTGLQRGLEHLDIESNGITLARHARQWIEARDQQPGDKKPLFVWMHVLEPHNWTLPTGEGRNDEERKRFYDRSLTTSDAALAEVMNAFSHRDPRHAPIVIVTADHGEGLGEHGHPYHSTDLYDAQTHVPLVIAGPGIPPTRVGETVSLVDLVPTVMELAGFVAPGGRAIDGRSIADLATGHRAGDPERGDAFIEMVADRSNPGGITAFVRGRWKLITNENGSPELYDTRADPEEIHNVYNGKPGMVIELRRLMDQRVVSGAASPFD